MMRVPHPVSIRNLTADTTVCSSLEVADTFRPRLAGLLGRHSLDEDAGLLLLPSSGIHTLGMRFAIDVVLLDKDLCIRALRPYVKPWRVCLPCRGTHSALELRAGRIERCNLRVGDRLSLQPALQPA